jgi:hypothetical protein
MVGSRPQAYSPFGWVLLEPPYSLTQPLLPVGWVQLTTPHRTFACADHMTAHPSIPLHTYASVGKHTRGNSGSVPLTQNWQIALFTCLPHSHSTPRGAQKAVALSTELWAHSSARGGYPPLYRYHHSKLPCGMSSTRDLSHTLTPSTCQR